MWSSNSQTDSSASNCLIEIDGTADDPVAIRQPSEDKNEEFQQTNAAKIICSNSKLVQLSHFFTSKGLIFLVLALFLINLLTSISLGHPNCNNADLSKTIQVDELTKDVVKRLHLPIKSETCGGLLNFTQATIFRYENSASKMEFCIWVLSIPEAAAVNAILTEIRGNARLEIHTQFTNNVTTALLLSKADLLREQNINSNAAILIYFPDSSKSPNSNDPEILEFAFSFLGRGYSTELNVDVYNLEARTTALEIDYPKGAEKYKNNERGYYIIRPPTSGKVRVSMTFFQTELRHDYLAILKYSKDAHEFQLVAKLTGNILSPPTFQGDESQPVLLYFYTDGSGVHSGFRATYSNVQV